MSDYLVWAVLGLTIGSLVSLILSLAMTFTRPDLWVEGNLTYFREADGTMRDAQGKLRPEPPTHCPRCRRRLVFHSWDRYPSWRCDGWVGRVPLFNRVYRGMSFDRGWCYTFRMPILNSEGEERILNYVGYPKPKITVFGRDQTPPGPK